jgi:hypothetical protein
MVGQLGTPVSREKGATNLDVDLQNLCNASFRPAVGSQKVPICYCSSERPSTAASPRTRPVSLSLRIILKIARLSFMRIGSRIRVFGAEKSRRSRSSQIDIGARLDLAGRRCVLQEGSEDARKVMESHLDEFVKWIWPGYCGS